MNLAALLRLFPFLLLFILTGCLESSFSLSNDSRLPKWFELSEDFIRSDVSVKMDLHSTFSGGKIVFSLYEEDSFFSTERFEVTTEEQPGIRSAQLSESQEGFPDGYPRYKVIIINGITDIVELRKMEPIFYMTDDPKVWNELVKK